MKISASPRTSVDFHGIHGLPWISMDFHGYPWISMDFHGYPWISMDIHGYPRISMDIHGYPWTSMNIHGHPWISMEVHGLYRKSNENISKIENPSIPSPSYSLSKFLEPPSLKTASCLGGNHEVKSICLTFL